MYLGHYFNHMAYCFLCIIFVIVGIILIIKGRCCLGFTMNWVLYLLNNLYFLSIFVVLTILFIDSIIIMLENFLIMIGKLVNL
jgi:hypothetical protein